MISLICILQRKLGTLRKFSATYRVTTKYLLKTCRLYMCLKYINIVKKSLTTLIIDTNMHCSKIQITKQ